MIHATDLALDYQQQRAISSARSRVEEDFGKMVELMDGESYIQPVHAVDDLVDSLEQAAFIVSLVARNRYGIRR